MSKTKIVATIGPASSTPDVFRELLRAGLTVARVNFSHGNHNQHMETIAMLRRIADDEEKVLAILGDLQGPKIRLGLFDTVPLKANQEVSFSNDPDDPDHLHLPHIELFDSLSAGSRMIIGDGEMELEVVSNDGKVLRCISLYDGDLKARKGINTPGTSLSIPSITEKDRTDLEFMCQFRLDYVALSFVRSADDIHELNGLMEGHGYVMPIVAKIEKFEAMENLEAIAAVSDGLMVARGDLGLDLPTHQLPMLQKRIINVANTNGIPVITATQMLASMEHNPRPTRAEASDIANAILDGSDAIMLSNETAVGKYPVKAVETMRKIAENTENQFPYDLWRRKRREINALDFVADAISAAACTLAERIDARVIVTSTISGYTAKQIARHRPSTKIYASSPLPKTQRELALVWGVECVLMSQTHSTDEMIDKSLKAIKNIDFSVGDQIVITGGVPFSKPGLTNFIQIHSIEE
ncbi:MAG: pyruvate kinase [Chloroflexota bacterium]